MYEIEMNEMSEDFFACWRSAALHLGQKLKGGKGTWLRAHPYPPYREHLSFRVGNQLFFVRVEDVDGSVRGPSSRAGLLAAAGDANGRACILPMSRRSNGTWEPARPGWGLLSLDAGAAIDPAALVTDEKIEMTIWELQDMAVQVVCQHLATTGFKVTSWQGNPDIDPSLWFERDGGQLGWVVVRTVRFPAERAERPANWSVIEQRFAQMGGKGHFASVALVSANQPFRSAGEAPVPLWRGHPMHVRFEGLE